MVNHMGEFAQRFFFTLAVMLVLYAMLLFVHDDWYRWLIWGP